MKKGNYSFLKEKRIKKMVKYAFAASLLLIGACNKEEANSDELVSAETNSLSTNSVKLPVSSNNVIASSSHSRYPVSNAVDGNLSTRWTGNGIGTTLEIDLEREDLIDYIKIAHYRGRSRVYDFKVYTKKLAEDDWGLMGTKVSPGDTNELYIYDVSNSVARYVLIESNGNTANNWSDIVELEIYGTIGEPQTDECVAEVPETRYEQILENDLVLLNWTAIPNIDHYNLRYKKVNETGWTYEYSIEANVIALNGLTKGEEYEWQIRAKCADGSGTNYNDATSYFTTPDEDDPSEGGVPGIPPGTFNLADFQIETSWLTGEASRTTQSFPAISVSSEPWYTRAASTYVLTSLRTDGNRTEWKEFPGKEASLSVYKNMQYLAKFENIPENGVTIAQVHNRGGVNRPLLRVYIHDDNQIHVKVTLTTPDEASSTYYTSEGINYTEGDDVKTQILIEDGEIEITVETGGSTLSETIVPSSDWDNYSDSYYLKAGVYTEGNDTFVRGIFNYFSVEK